MKRINKRNAGFTLVELLVVISIIGVLAVILVPNIIGAIAGSQKQADESNLKKMVEAVLAKKADTRLPNATGHQFWIALCVGDGTDENGGLEITSIEDQDIFILPDDAANLLRSPGDQEANDKDAVKDALIEALESGGGLPNDTEYMTSYAGPTSKRRFDDRDQPVIGCTGGREETTVFADGFNSVNANGSTKFYAYTELVEEEDWDEMEDPAPQFGKKPLEHVTWEPENN